MLNIVLTMRLTIEVMKRAAEKAQKLSTILSLNTSLMIKSTSKWC